MNIDEKPMFPEGDLVSKSAEQLLAGNEVSEDHLKQLERRVLNWIIKFDGRHKTIDEVSQTEKYATQKYAMEIPETILVAGARTGPVLVTAQRTIRVQRLLLCSSKSLDRVKITRFMIGAEEPAQFMSGLSAELFRVMSRNGIYIEHQNTLNPGMQCLLMFENLGSEDVDISGAILGECLRYY